MKKPFQIKFSEQQLARLRQLAATTGQSVAEIVRYAVQQYVDDAINSQLLAAMDDNHGLRLVGTTEQGTNNEKA